MTVVRPNTLEALLHRFDVALRELKVKYDQFFAGALDRQPFELRAEIERIIDLKSAEVVRNGSWFERFGLIDVIKLGATTTLMRMLERKDFKERVEEQRHGGPVEARHVGEAGLLPRLRRGALDLDHRRHGSLGRHCSASAMRSAIDSRFVR